jgi:hypothetical protein
MRATSLLQASEDCQSWPEARQCVRLDSEANVATPLSMPRRNPFQAGTMTPIRGSDDEPEVGCGPTLATAFSGVASSWASAQLPMREVGPGRRFQ